MRAHQSGMSLVEVMVAVLIGLIGILIITQAYITNDNFNRSTLGEGGAQTNGLIALYTVERDVRMSGYGIANSAALGCGNIYWYYDPNYSSNVTGGSLPNITIAPIVITRDTTAPVDVEPVQITVMYATNAERLMPVSINSFNPSSSVIEVDGVSGFLPGDLILMLSSTGCTMAQVTSVLSVSQKLQVNPGGGGPYNPSAWGLFPTTYSGGDQVMNLGNPIVRTYSVSNSKLQVTDGFLQTGTGTLLELVDGIVDMRAQYGHDTDGDDDVDVWNSDTPTTSAGWQRVLAVRMGMMARIGNYEKPSVSGGDCDATTAAPTWSGSSDAGGAFAKLSFAAGSQDRCYRYRVFETTVPLRNMIWRSL